MHIRRFMPGDEAFLFRVYFSAIHDIASRDYSPEEINAWAPIDVDWSLWNRRMCGINPFVAVLDDEIVGYADVQSDGYIDHFFVSGTRPRQGIGKRLMEHIHKDAKNKNLVELTSHVSKTAEPFFLHYGFVVMERRHSVSRGVRLPNALMRKTLRLV